MYLKDKSKKIKDFMTKQLAKTINFGIFLTKRVKNDALLRVASALSYTSLLAIVPLLAIGLAVFAAFPVFSDTKEHLQAFIIHNFLPGMTDEVTYYFNEFIRASARLTAIGVVGITITAIMLLSTIENAFNFIFKVNKPRRFTTKITLYWTIITLGPLLLGTGFSLRGYIYAIRNIMSDSMGTIQTVITNLLPSTITIILLVAVYTLVPNKKVRLINAFWGAVVTAVLFAVLRSGFGSILLSGATYRTLYGALATVPLLLVWMYLAWAIVIFGAVFTAALEEYNPRTDHDKERDYQRQNYNNNKRSYQVRDYTRGNRDRDRGRNNNNRNFEK